MEIIERAIACALFKRSLHILTTEDIRKDVCTGIMKLPFKPYPRSAKIVILRGCGNFKSARLSERRKIHAENEPHPTKFISTLPTAMETCIQKLPYFERQKTNGVLSCIERIRSEKSPYWEAHKKKKLFYKNYSRPFSCYVIFGDDIVCSKIFAQKKLRSR